MMMVMQRCADGDNHGGGGWDDAVCDDVGDDGGGDDGVEGEDDNKDGGGDERVMLRANVYVAVWRCVPDSVVGSCRILINPHKNSRN